jgi:type II secretory pathway pseudopilin PulG
MRWKIMIVNSAVLIIVGLLSFVLVRVSLEDVLANRTQRRSDAERAVRSANMQFELDSLRLERWLASRAVEEAVSEVFAGGTSQARSETASLQAKRLRDAAMQSPALSALSIPIVLFVDARGIVIGRNDSSQMRGEDLGRAYPSIVRALSSGQTSSQVWLNRQRSEQLLVSYAPVRGEGGSVLGIVVAGMPLNDERLSLISQATSGQALTVGVASDPSSVEVIAQGTLSGQRALFEAIRQHAVLSRAAASLKTGRAIFDDDEAVYASEPLSGYDSSNVLLVAALSQSLVPSVAGLLWPLFAVTLLGIILVVAGGIFLGNYISEPISQLEEGLLSVINGRTNHRFDIQHPDLGGLVFRLNSLLNALMGVPDIDADGRTSVPPGARYREAEGP